MFRPELDDDLKEKVAEIVDESVTVPLPADELTFNQQLRIIVRALHAEMQEHDNPQLIIDRHYMKSENDGPDWA
jgi:hypothetical protein